MQSTLIFGLLLVALAHAHAAEYNPTPKQCAKKRAMIISKVMGAIADIADTNAYPSFLGVQESLWQAQRLSVKRAVLAVLHGRAQSLNKQQSLAMAPQLPAVILQEMKKQAVSGDHEWIDMVKKTDPSKYDALDTARTGYLQACYTKVENKKDTKSCKFVAPGSPGAGSDIDVSVDGANPSKCLQEFMKACSIDSPNQLATLTSKLDTNFYPISYMTQNKDLVSGLGASCFRELPSRNKAPLWIFKNADNSNCKVEDILEAKMAHHGASDHVKYVKLAATFHENYLGKGKGCDGILSQLLEIIKMADESYWTEGAFTDVVAMLQVMGGGDWTLAKTSDAFRILYGHDTVLAAELHWQSFMENMIDVHHYITDPANWQKLQSKSKYVMRALCSCAEYEPAAVKECGLWNKYVKECRRADLTRSTNTLCKSKKIDQKLRNILQKCTTYPDHTKIKTHTTHVVPVHVKPAQK